MAGTAGSLPLEWHSMLYIRITVCPYGDQWPHPLSWCQTFKHSDTCCCPMAGADAGIDLQRNNVSGGLSACCAAVLQHRQRLCNTLH